MAFTTCQGLLAPFETAAAGPAAAPVLTRPASCNALLLLIKHTANN
jgi:hypothetical protein